MNKILDGNDTASVGTVEPRIRWRGVRGAVLSFSLFAASLMILTAFGPIFQAAAQDSAHSYSYEFPSPSSTPQEDGFFPLDFGSDEDLPVYTPVRKTSSSYTDTASIRVEASRPACPVLFSENAQEYSYVTGLGTYRCSKSDPSVFSLSNSAGRLLATSWFAVESNHALDLGEAMVAQANRLQFVVSRTVTSGGCIVGELTVEMAFINSSAPKITARLSLTDVADVISFSICWNIDILGQSVKVGDRVLSNLDLSRAQFNYEGAFSLESGKADASGLWNADCRIDWSDARSGSLEVETALDGVSAKVRFPWGMTCIDPTIVATSDSKYATSGSPFRNIVFYDGTYWLFYSDNKTIWYVSSSDGGLSWSQPLSLPTQVSLAEGVNCTDVAIRANHIALCWVENRGGDGCSEMRFMEGYISGRAISWNPSISFGRMNWAGHI